MILSIFTVINFKNLEKATNLKKENGKTTETYKHRGEHTSHGINPLTGVLHSDGEGERRQ